MKIKDKKTGKVKDVKLPKAFKNKWIKALRSGDYQQCGGKLYNGEGYCCLGVACKILHPKIKLEGKGVISKKELGNSYKNIKVPKLLHGYGNMNNVEGNLVVNKLAGMNDSGKYSFKRIATWIEKNL